MGQKFRPMTYPSMNKATQQLRIQVPEWYGCSLHRVKRQEAKQCPQRGSCSTAAPLSSRQPLEEGVTGSLGCEWTCTRYSWLQGQRVHHRIYFTTLSWKPPTNKIRDSVCLWAWGKCTRMNMGLCTNSECSYDLQRGPLQLEKAGRQKEPKK